MIHSTVRCFVGVLCSRVHVRRSLHNHPGKGNVTVRILTVSDNHPSRNPCSHRTQNPGPQHGATDGGVRNRQKGGKKGVFYHPQLGRLRTKYLWHTNQVEFVNLCSAAHSFLIRRKFCTWHCN